MRQNRRNSSRRQNHAHHKKRRSNNSRNRPRKRSNPRKHSFLSRLFYKSNRFVRRHPIISAVGSIVLSIFLLRVAFSDNLFGNNVSEFRLWFIFFAILIGIIGLISLKVWFSNNVSDFNAQIKWKNR